MTPENHDTHAISTLPGPGDRRQIPPNSRVIVLASVLCAGAALIAVIVGIILLGLHAEGINEVATTGLASIGATLAGGFAGWIARGQVERAQQGGRRASDQQ